MFPEHTISMTTRQPAAAGSFYPGNKVQLEAQIMSLLDRARPESSGGTSVALISPHAGYQFSGLTAAYGYKLLIQHQFDSVVVISPSHREYFDGISVFNGEAYRTPIGILAVDHELRNRLVEGERDIHPSYYGHREEHAIEVQLPFVQATLRQVTILPIVMGDQRRDYCYLLGEKLAAILKGTRSLVIASTDLSHYHPYAEAVALDRIVIEAIGKFDHEKLMDDLEAERVEACGGGPTVAALIAASKLGANRIEILHHCNSGDVTGDHDRVVGYLSAIALRAN